MGAIFGDRDAVSLINHLFGSHGANLNNAMDRTSRRFGVLSNNMANINVPNYKRQDMNFAIQLEEASGRTAPSSLNAIDQEEQDGEIRVDGSTVDLEKEVVSIAETEARYNMLAEMTSRYFSGLKNVIREGR